MDPESVKTMCFSIKGAPGIWQGSSLLAEELFRSGSSLPVILVVDLSANGMAGKYRSTHNVSRRLHKPNTRNNGYTEIELRPRDQQ